MHIIRTLTVVAASLTLAVLAGCSSTTKITVPVPPRMDLAQFNTIGLVTFTSNETDPQLRRHCTQQFLQAIHDAQPGTRVIELGEESRVLASVDRNKWDARTLSAVQSKHGVDAVIIGRFNTHKSKPDVQLSSVSQSISMKSNVTGALSARILETQSGATMWTDAADMTMTVAGAQFNTRGEGGFGATDADKAYRDMVDCLVNEVTDDFRTHYITKRVPKDQVQTASVAGTDF